MSWCEQFGLSLFGDGSGSVYYSCTVEEPSEPPNLSSSSFLPFAVHYSVEGRGAGASGAAPNMHLFVSVFVSLYTGNYYNFFSREAAATTNFFRCQRATKSLCSEKQKEFCTGTVLTAMH